MAPRGFCFLVLGLGPIALTACVEPAPAAADATSLAPQHRYRPWRLGARAPCGRACWRGRGIWEDRTWDPCGARFDAEDERDCRGLEMPTLIGASRRGRRMLLLLFLAGAITLADRPLAAAGYTLDELMREAVTRNRDLRAARAQVDAALGRLTQSGLLPNPRLELSNGWGVFANQGAFTRSVGITQDFPIAGRIGRAQDVARVDVARALVEINEAELKLLADIAKAFYDIVVLDQKIALRDRLIKIAARQSG